MERSGAEGKRTVAAGIGKTTLRGKVACLKRMQQPAHQVAKIREQLRQQIDKGSDRAANSSLHFAQTGMSSLPKPLSQHLRDFGKEVNYVVDQLPEEVLDILQGDTA